MPSTNPATPSQPNPSDAPFGRVLTAMVTPFKPDGALDLDGAQRVATHLVDTGCDGLVVSGTTGESPTTSDAEKEQLVRAVVDAVGDRAHVVAGVGTYDTHHTVELAGQAEKAGARGLLVVTPYYNKPPQAGLVHHFRTVADATGLPVILYDIPGRTGTAIETETLLRLSEHQRIVAVKDAKGDLFAGSDVIARTGLAFYSGDDALNLPWLSVGAVGMVSVVSHVAATRYEAMVRAFDAGETGTALRLHRELIPVVAAIMTKKSQGAIMAKAALTVLGVLSSRTVRSPLVDATDEQAAELRTVLAASGLLT
jgi:4-hydroxy-tetrahydrodipicolinate synthase